jgi:DNA repair exonuclease SbcCD ATPase subunit
MQLNRIDLLGFRQLVNRSFDFKPGLNLVYGPNEAGKSTLMEAVAIMLYGFFDTGRISSKERDALNQHKPWSYMGAFGGTLKYTLSNGEVFQIRRTFAPEISTTLIRTSDQRNITDGFRSESDGRVYFAEEHLGISKSVFENVCVVRQSELALLEQSATPIAETIMRLSSTMATDGFTVNEALALLETTFKQKVGTPRAHSKPLAVTKKRVEQLKKAIDDAKATRKRSWEVLTSVNTSKADITQLEKRYSDSQILLLKSRLYNITETLDRIASLQRETDEAKGKAADLQEWSDFRHDIYEQLLNLDARRISFETDSGHQNLPEKLVTLKNEQQNLVAQIESFKSLPVELIHRIGAKKKNIEKATQAVEVAHRQVEKLQAEVDKAQSVIEMLSSEVRYVKMGHSSLAKLQHQYESVQKDLAKSLADLEGYTAEWKRANIEESAFLALKDTPLDTPRKKGCKPLTRKAKTENSVPSEIAIYNDLLPIYTQWKNAQASVKKSEQSKNDIEARVRRELYVDDIPIEAKIFEQASTKIDEFLKNVTASEVASRNLEEAKTALQEAEELLKTLEEQLNDILPEGIRHDQDIEAEYQQIHRLRQRLLDVETQIKEAGDEDAKRRHKNEEYEQVLQDLHELYKKARINEALSLEEKLQHYKSEREKYLAWQNADREARAAEKRLQEFPFQSDKLTKQGADLEQQLQTLVDQNPDAESLKPVETADYYQSEVEKLQQQIQDMKQRQIMLTNEAKQASESMIDLAGLLEEYAETTAELKRLEWFGEALQTAQTELAKASTTFQQQFTPRLQAYLNSGLSHATGERYTESLVDPETLIVRLLAPETHRWVYVDQLSTGTRDLVYLLLRFSIAQLMSHSGEPLPMLLDDPFVHCDRQRKANILTYLINQASDMQFILFTQDDWTLSWLNTNYSNCNMIVMSYDENTTIDYTLVDTLTDQSEAVRERLLAVEEGEEVSVGLSLEDTTSSSSASKEIISDSPQEIPDLSEEILQDLSDVLSSDETAIKILALLEQSGWETHESDFHSILHGQFLSVALDSLNNRSLDILGDQLVYIENEHLTVTEEYRPSLSHFLRQVTGSKTDPTSTDIDNK